MWIVCLFVCVAVLQLSQPNGIMSSVVSLPNQTFTGQAKSSKQLLCTRQKLKTVLLEAAEGKEWADKSLKISNLISSKN